MTELEARAVAELERLAAEAAAASDPRLRRILECAAGSISRRKRRQPPPADVGAAEPTTPRPFNGLPLQVDGRPGVPQRPAGEPPRGPKVNAPRPLRGTPIGWR